MRNFPDNVLPEHVRETMKGIVRVDKGKKRKNAQLSNVDGQSGKEPTNEIVHKENNNNGKLWLIMI